MNDTNSDEDMLKTQNVIRQADSDDNIDLLHEILFGEERLQQADDELSTVPIANAKKVRESYYLFLTPSLKKYVLTVYRRVQNTTLTGPFMLGKSGQKYEIAKVQAVGKICTRSFNRRFYTCRTTMKSIAGSENLF